MFDLGESVVGRVENMNTEMMVDVLFTNIRD